MHLFEIQNTLFTLLGYNVCLLELVGALLGIVGVWFATQGKSINFFFCIASFLCLMFFFYQKGLYSSMILQGIMIYFSGWGYIKWKFPPKRKANANSERKIAVLSQTKRLLAIGILLGLVFVWGSVMSFHMDKLPSFFSIEYKHIYTAYLDAFVLMLSFSGMFFRAFKYIENWASFLISDGTGIVLYAMSGSYFIVLMCSIYFLLDIKALLSWKKLLQKQQ